MENNNNNTEKMQLQNTAPSACEPQKAAAPEAKPAVQPQANAKAPQTIAQRSAQKKKIPFFKKLLRNASIVISCVFEEIGMFFVQAFRKINNSSLGFKMTAAAVLFTCICTGLVVGLTMLVHGEANDGSVSDCVLGAKKHIITEDQKASYVVSDTEAATEKTDDRFSVTIDFFTKDDVSCVSAKRTVGELIECLGISLSETDMLREDESTVITEDTVIHIDELSYGTDKVSKSISYDVEYVDVQTIPRGTEKTHRRGVAGKEIKEYTVTYVNGEETERSLTKEYVGSYPVSAVVYRGVGGTVNIGGKAVKFSYYIDCDSTFYYSGGITASGLPADEKVVAVDPRVIPLGTKLYIPGIGERIAADTGGAIKGNIIDICFDRSNPLTATYGRRGARVYILG